MLSGAVCVCGATRARVLLATAVQSTEREARQDSCTDVWAAKHCMGNMGARASVYLCADDM